MKAGTRRSFPGGLVADICDGEQAVEIQTGSAYPLRGKLERLLPLMPVTVVLPVVRRKTLVWLDPDTGEASVPRKSPRVGGFWDRLPDLYWLLPYLAQPGLTIRLVELDLEEFRTRDGWGRDGETRVPSAGAYPCRARGGTGGCEAPPTAPVCCRRTAWFIYHGRFEKAGRLSPKKAGYAINFLYKYKAVIRMGKSSNAYLYRLVGSEKAEIVDATR